MCFTKKSTKTPPEPISKDSADKKKKTTIKKGKKFPMMNMIVKNKKNEVQVEKKPEEVPEQNKSVKDQTKKEEVKVVEEDKVEKKVEQKKPIINRPNCVAINPRSATSGKKNKYKFKYGQIDQQELSINNDKTEYLENAQLTKLMSHADVRALMGGQFAQGENADTNNCQDTVEEVDSEMLEIAFSPLLAVIPREDERVYGAFVHPTEQKKNAEA